MVQLSGNKETWVGGGDQVQEGSFTWSDGTPWAWEDWMSGQPDNGWNWGWEKEDCVMITAAGGWDDVDLSLIHI